MTPARTVAWWITCAALAGLTACQSPSPTPGCVAADITSEQLVGTWQVTLEGDQAPWTLVLRPHPEHEGSLRGALMQNPRHLAVVADIEAGELTMEESHDGMRIAATWLGQVQAGSCGQLIRGERLNPASDERPRGFQMRATGLR